jgi:hypothetical protein
MTPERSEAPRQARATVVPMPPREPQPAQTVRPSAPAAEEHQPPGGEEPGYGHGV